MTTDDVRSLLNLTDHVSVQHLIYDDVTEIVALDDTMTSWKNFADTVNDTLTASDISFAIRRLVSSVVETLPLIEEIEYSFPQVLLYPVDTILWEDALAHISTAISGHLTVIPFTFTQKLEIILTQTGFTQDYSLRAWVSVYRNGTPIDGDWVANKVPNQKRVLYSAAMSSPGFIGILLEDGADYYLNILNQTAATTTFALVATALSKG